MRSIITVPTARTAKKWLRALLILLISSASCHYRAGTSDRHTDAKAAEKGPVEQPVIGSTKERIHTGEVPGGGRLVRYVKPEYPERLRQKHVSGIVYLKVLVGRKGVPEQITYMRGPKELVTYAERAVEQWRYEPIVINGHPIEFLTVAAVQFTLTQ